MPEGITHPCRTNKEPNAMPYYSVAIVGRPNVGKSTLLNALVGSRIAIEADSPGVTRDRVLFHLPIADRTFALVDTGGLTRDGHARVEKGPEGIRGLGALILEQAKEAVRESDLLCLVVDARDGQTQLDRYLADFLRKQGKPILLVVNKVDGPEQHDLLLADFHDFGLDLFACSAEHGYNVRALEEEIRERLFPQPDLEEEVIPEDSILLDGASRRQKKRLLAGLRDQMAAGKDLVAEEEEPESVAQEDAETGSSATPGEDAPQAGPEPKGGESVEESFIGVDGETYVAGQDEQEAPEEAAQEPEPALYAGPDLYSGPLKLALLGRPNAGKSSLVNALVGQNRMIVSDVAGTTRDSVDVTTEIDGEECTFVDTAGVRRRSKITDTVERYSVNSSLKSTTKAHVTLLVLDATEGLTLQDKRLIDLLDERKTPFMVLVNKSDLIEPRDRKAAEKIFREALSFCPHVPILFVSAMNRHNLFKIVPLARSIRQECGIRVPTGQLNRIMASVLERHQAPLVRRLRPKFFYLTQAESLPPTFVFFVNDAERVKPSYARYLERSLRKMFGIRHAPMRVNFRSAHSKKGKKR